MEFLGNDMIENKFSSLSDEEKVSVISHGVALRLPEWKKRLFLAESKVRFFEEKYHISLAELDTKGLPDDADHEMHEDYIMWHHWIEVVEKAKKQVADLEAIAAFHRNQFGRGNGNYSSVIMFNTYVLQDTTPCVPEWKFHAAPDSP